MKKSEECLIVESTLKEMDFNDGFVKVCSEGVQLRDILNDDKVMEELIECAVERRDFEHLWFLREVCEVLV